MSGRHDESVTRELSPRQKAERAYYAHRGLAEHGDCPQCERLWRAVVDAWRSPAPPAVTHTARRV